MPDVLSGLIWVQIVCKCNQQTTVVSKEFMTKIQVRELTRNSELGMYIKLKDKDYCPIEIIKGLTDKGQFQYLTKLMGPQEGTYLYETQFHSLR